MVITSLVCEIKIKSVHEGTEAIANSTQAIDE